MQSFYPERFDRDMACTEADWLSWLPNAIGDNPWQLNGSSADLHIGKGKLALTWEKSEPRAIALMRMPRLLVSFGFSGLDEAQRYAFMKRFDLYMQRGGG